MPEPAVVEKPADTPAPVAPDPKAAAPAPAPAPAPAAEPKPADTTTPKEGDQKPSLLGSAKDPDAKPGDKPASVSTAPEKYVDPKLPEGMVLDKELWDKMTPLFKEKNFSQDDVQKIATLQAEHVKAQTESMIQQANKIQTDQIAAWEAETKKMFGVDWQKELGYVGKALDAVKGGAEMRKLLDSSQWGANPVIAKFLNELGKMVGETKPGEGANIHIENPDDKQKRSLFPRMYDGSGGGRT